MVQKNIIYGKIYLEKNHVVYYKITKQNIVIAYIHQIIKIKSQKC